MEEYHDLADKTMTELLDTLEDTLDSGSEDPSYEVDYHVRSAGHVFCSNSVELHNLFSFR
jgi:frataxin-like iron-binding protein CyaY